MSTFKISQRVRDTEPDGSLIPQTIQGDIPSGQQGNLATIEVMKAVARDRASHPIIRDCAKEIVRNSNVKDMDYLGEAKAITHWVKENVRYIRDMLGLEQLHDPLTMLDMIRKGKAQGDCDDISLLIATMLISIGQQPLFRVVKYRFGQPNYSHVYVVVYDKNHRQPKQRLVLDGIVKDRPIGWEVPHLEGREIPV